MTAIPTPPSRSNPTTFAALADPFLAYFETLYLEAQALTIAAASSGITAYAGGTTYALGDVVTYNDTFWVSLAGSNTGNTPSSSPAWWMSWLESKLNVASPAFTGSSSGPAVFAVSASDIDCSKGHAFSKTVSGSLTLTVSNVPDGHYIGEFILTNGGLGTLTLPAGSETAGGGAFTLSSAGTDRLGFMTEDGGTSWVWWFIGADFQ